MSGVQIITDSTVTVNVTSVSNQFGAEKRFPKNLTILDFKGKLELLTGGHQKTMKLQLYNKDNKLVCLIDDDSALLGSYPIDDGMRIHVEDKNLTAGEFDDVSKVEKFELNEEEYAQRSDSVRAFKERNKMGRFNPELVKKKEEQKQQQDLREKEKVETMKIGDRCETHVSGQPTRRGTIKYIGTTDFKPGLWVGIQYDEPHGKNDGSVDGKRYFECMPKYGGFVKPLFVDVGDFPEEDFGLEDEM
ncbi:hypothetical protein SNE40_008715 [Patella caerulea]|uniref:CAP-Gly domain-containing protein n=1 Tax=Patella caerulea TaxID=87958 RepID=A0AAN8JQI7_PATCE